MEVELGQKGPAEMLSMNVNTYVHCMMAPESILNHGVTPSRLCDRSTIHEGGAASSMRYEFGDP